MDDIALSISMANLKMNDVTLIGISKFRIKNLAIEIKEMKASIQIEFKTLVINGTYKLTSMLSRSKGTHSSINDRHFQDIL